MLEIKSKHIFILYEEAYCCYLSKKLLNNEMTRIVSTLSLIKCRERKKEREKKKNRCLYKLGLLTCQLIWCLTCMHAIHVETNRNYQWSILGRHVTCSLPLGGKKEKQNNNVWLIFNMRWRRGTNLCENCTGPFLLMWFSTVSIFKR